MHSMIYYTTETSPGRRTSAVRTIIHHYDYDDDDYDYVRCCYCY